MRTLNLRLHHSQVAAAAGCAELLVPNNCTIVGAVWNATCTGGAAPGYYSSELALNNNSTTWAASNNPPRESTLCSNKHIAIPSTASQQNSGFIPLNVQVRAGERLSINQTMTGTAASTNHACCDVFVIESR